MFRSKKIVFISKMVQVIFKNLGEFRRIFCQIIPKRPNCLNLFNNSLQFIASKSDFNGFKRKQPCLNINVCLAWDKYVDSSEKTKIPKHLILKSWYSVQLCITVKGVEYYNFLTIFFNIVALQRTGQATHQWKLLKRSAASLTPETAGLLQRCVLLTNKFGSFHSV